MLIPAIMMVLSSCDVLFHVLSTAAEMEAPLTTEQVSSGLKQALEIGAREAVRQLNTTDGYYLNPALKIALPAETQEILEHAKKIPGVDQLLEQLVLQLNRSAEDAAKMAQPILVNAITSMTIGDAWAILRGEANAATTYLHQKTYNSLTNLYAPEVGKSLGKPLVAGVSAKQSWEEVVSRWNTFANSIAGTLLGLRSLEYSLEEYVTQQALNGLFHQIELKEMAIRADVTERTSALLQKVFGQV